MDPGGLDDLAAEVERRSPSSDPLEHLAAAVGLAGELAARSDALVGHFVNRAREAGCSWAQVGGALGVSRQAAQQQAMSRRLRSAWAPWLRRPGARPPPFSLFTDRARRAVVAAQAEADGLGHTWVGTEHLLLGLLAEGEGVAAKALDALGVEPGGARASVARIVGAGGEPPSSGPRSFTPRTKKVFELALRESLRLGHDYIGTEHLLLGLVAEGEGVAAQVLADLAGDLPRVRQAVLGRLPGGGTAAGGR